ncbi:MAG: IS1595 family transposase, partial [Janthinobacterium lividum]
MRPTGFTRLLRSLPSLTRQQRAQLATALQPAIAHDSVCAAIDGARPAPLCCPDCGSSRHYRHGINR